MRQIKFCAGLIVVGLMSVISTSQLYAAVAYDESAPGATDLSGNGLSPTFLTQVTGSNEVRGITGNPGNGTGGTDRDYFSFVVPASPLSRHYERH